MAHTEQKRSSAPLFWIAAVVVLVAAVLAIRSLTRETVGVKVALVTYQTLSSVEPTNGKVEPIDDWQAHAPAPGVVQHVYFNEGDKVTAGDLVVRMDDDDAHARVASAQASLAQAQLQLADITHGGSSEERGNYASNIASARLEQQAAVTNLATVKILQQKGSASASEVAAAQQRLSAANLSLSTASGHSTARFGAEDLASAQATVANARAALKAAQDALAESDIHSPISGTAYYVPVVATDFINIGEPLIDVADLTKLRVRAYFDEPEIGGLGNGQPVEIEWPAKPGRVWHGHVEQTPTTVINYNTRNVGECIITVDDADGDLPPHSNVTVKVIEAQRENVLSIPREALHTDGANNFVFRIVDGKLQQTPVQIGLVTLTRVEVKGGLSANEEVVLGPATPGKDLSNGLVVKPVR